jgi:hypothetical protein
MYWLPLWKAAASLIDSPISKPLLTLPCMRNKKKDFRGEIVSDAKKRYWFYG